MGVEQDKSQEASKARGSRLAWFKYNYPNLDENGMKLVEEALTLREQLDANVFKGFVRQDAIRKLYFLCETISANTTQLGGTVLFNRIEKKPGGKFTLIQPHGFVTPENVQNYSPAVAHVESLIALTQAELALRKAKRLNRVKRPDSSDPRTLSGKYTISEVINEANRTLKS